MEVGKNVLFFLNTTSHSQEYQMAREIGENQPNIENRKLNSTLGERISDIFSRQHTFILAMVVIVAFLVFYYIAVVNHCVYKITDETSGIDKISATLGPIVASIIGYYFGQRPIKPLTEEAKKARNEKDAYKEFSNETVQAAEGLEQRIDNLEKQLQLKDEFINKLKRDLGV